MQEDLPNMAGELKKAEAELNASKNRSTSITADLRKYQSQLEEKKCSMSANRSRNRVLDFLMRLKMEGRVPGIFGRLVSTFIRHKHETVCEISKKFEDLWEDVDYTPKNINRNFVKINGKILWIFW